MNCGMGFVCRALQRVGPTTARFMREALFLSALLTSPMVLAQPDTLLDRSGVVARVKALNRQALNFYSSEKYAEGDSVAREAVELTESKLGPEHPDTAAGLNNLALLYESIGAHDKALPLFQRSLAILEKALGPEHPDTATILNNLAELYRAMGAYDKALPLYQRALPVALGRMRLGFDPTLLRLVAGNVCELSAAASPPRIEEAIFYCKLAVNAGQFQRAGAKGLERELRESLAQNVEGPYRKLAQLLADSGRWPKQNRRCLPSRMRSMPSSFAALLLEGQIRLS